MGRLVGAAERYAVSRAKSSWGRLRPMPIWRDSVSLELLQERSQNTLVSHLGIEFIEAGDDFLKARMPVDARTHQPAHMLHGGASVALAETLASWGATFV